MQHFSAVSIRPNGTGNFSNPRRIGKTHKLHMQLTKFSSLSGFYIPYTLLLLYLNFKFQSRPSSTLYKQMVFEGILAPAFLRSAGGP
jgi:hypothetical protein